ncbi:DnaD domain protein [Papillibacter cinnamivorans]|uniref:DnaD and phage-associated domain-containing protein n=1 Tax=Papillibacter cinnamivorans DSM 12816 TaxID=1122930 RepID=A0A1W2A8G3_9FIRM|nr:DnaD domain protein [Papillibacter cinnamivorans]SMC56926.1 DnaD and phage-associated domain-containing protein [Papillibacter cinnamivorans DSM 12816]
MPDIKLSAQAIKTVSIPSAAITRLLSEGDGNAALLYLALLENTDPQSPASIRQRFGWSEEQLSSAAKTLKRTNLLEEDISSAKSSPPLKTSDKALPEAPPERELPEYTANDIVRAMEGTEEFRLLVNEAQRRLGKVLSNTDLTVLFGLYDYVGLPAEVLYLLINYCIDESVRRYGSGRKPTMRQIEKEGYAWARRGIDTEERAAAHIKRLELMKSDVQQVMGVLQISGRSPSRTEDRYISSWLEMGFGPEAVELAYDKTVLKCKELNWNYLNSILKNWHEKNFHQPQEIEKGNTAPPGRSTSCSPGKETSKRREIEQMKQYLKQIKEQG